jgi:polar amino acid transport system substrate-binding protein
MKLAPLVLAAVVAASAAAGGREPVADGLPPLRVAVAPLAAAAEWQGERPVGAIVDVWAEIASRIGRQTEFIRLKKFSEELAVLVDGTVDVSLGPMAITAERERSIDLTHPVAHSGLRVAVRESRETGLLAAMRGLPVKQLLGLLSLVLVLALLSGHLLWWFERGHNPKSFPARYPRGMWEAVWWIASTVVTGGCDDKHIDGVLGRAIAFAWMVGGIVLVAAFTGVLAASITAEKVTGSIRGVRDLAGRVVGCQEASVSVPALRGRGAIPREYARMDDALDALQAGTVEAVVGESLQLATLLGRPDRHDLRIVGPTFEVFDYGLGLPPGSPLREEINAAILQMREDGGLERILARWFGRHD